MGKVSERQRIVLRRLENLGGKTESLPTLRATHTLRTLAERGLIKMTVALTESGRAALQKDK